jgi:WD40 repeat protein
MYWQTLERYGDLVRAVAFLPDSKTLALALYDKTIVLWDTATGVYWQTLEGYSCYVSSHWLLLRGNRWL